jgi:hypothetical protein
MTDHEPDNLYDALRERLAHHGQEPPAPLWASIRAQLPPPVAPPQLRRRRRWVPVTLLMLMLAVVGGVYWQWQHTQAPTGAAPSARLATTTSAGPNPTLGLPKKRLPAAATTAPPLGNAAVQSPTPSPGAAAHSAAATVAAVPRTDKAKAGTNTPLAQPNKPLASAALPSAMGAVAVDLNEGAGAVASRKHHQRARAEAAATSAASTGLAAHETTMQQTGRLGATQSKAGFAETGTAEAGAATRNRAAKTVARHSAALIAATKPSRLSAAVARQRRARRHAEASEISATASGSSDAPTGVLLPAASAALRTTTAGLQGRPVAVQLPRLPALPAAQLVAVAPSPLTIPFVGRWAVQVLAGPALTYRQLSTVQQIAPSSIASPTSAAPTAASTVAALERPALGGGAQVGVRRALGQHWNLSAGLGYSEFATGLALQQVHTPSPQFARTPDSISTGIHRRDTYRFVTLPVRVGYAWTLTGRWRVGVLAGAEAAFYVGGSSTEGSACACQTQSYGPSGSPYRSLSVGASLGAEVRYRLTDRWELLAQPTGTYLLTPLARPTTSLVERHLFGGTALLGVSYDLP